MRTRILLSMTLALTLAGAAACGDDVTDPTSLVESAEAEAVMRSAEALPTLSGLIQAVEPGDEHARATLLRAIELWDGGTARDDRTGARQRRMAISYALPILTEDLTGDAWSDARARVDEWIRTAGSMLEHLSIPRVERRLEAARGYLDRADRSASDRSRRYYLLLAASELVETTPRFVARSLSHEADRAVSAAAATAPRETLERARRLKDWSSRAVEDGEYLLAIQRAYYALQLVSAP